MFRREKMSVDIYKVIWLLLHFIFHIVDACSFLITLAISKCSDLVRRYSGADSFLYDKHLIESNKKYLTKIPSHLAVVLGVETPNFKALSNIIFWCLSAGIKDISFYDYQGTWLIFDKCATSIVLIFITNFLLRRHFGSEQSQNLRLFVAVEKGK